MEAPWRAGHLWPLEGPEVLIPAQGGPAVRRVPPAVQRRGVLAFGHYFPTIRTATELRFVGLAARRSTDGPAPEAGTVPRAGGPLLSAHDSRDPAARPII